MFGAIAAYFLLTEHRAHFFGALPFLLLLAYPLMHIRQLKTENRQLRGDVELLKKHRPSLHGNSDELPAH